jgi:hypothetical protein
MHIKLNATVHAKSHHFSLLLSRPYCFSLTSHSTMTGNSNRISNATGNTATSGSQSGATAESETASLTSSSTMDDQAIANKVVPLLYEYWKAPTVIDKEITAYGITDRLSGVLLCTPTTLDFSTIDRTNIICFELHLMCGLGLLPIKFLVSILNHIGCELIHLNTNIITVLSCFCMLCECWLGIPHDTSSFCYFYSPTSYECKVFSSIGLSLHRNRWDEYLTVTFRSS